MTRRSAVIGAGTMGAGIAGVLAEHGDEVRLYSRSQTTLTRARDEISRRHGGALDRVTFSTDLLGCLEGAEFVSENIAEDAALKQQLFMRLEQSVPEECLLSTNTSSVPIGQIAQNLRAPERLVGMHWFNPPAVMPLVEIVRGPRTDDVVVRRTIDLAERLGRNHIVVARDVPGFVVNRLQYAMLREALHLVENEICTRREVDLAVESTLAPRWSAVGPLALMDLAGLDTVERVSGVLMSELSSRGDVPPLVRRLVTEGALGTKSGRGFYEWTPALVAETVERRDAMVRTANASARVTVADGGQDG